MLIKNIYNSKKWKNKELKDKRKLKIQSIINIIDTKKRNIKNDFSLSLNTILLIFRKILKGIFTTMLLFLVSTAIDTIFINLNWKTSIIKYLKYDKDLFMNFLISCVSIAGFLIALFYANLSGIFTSRYVHLSSRISKELLNESTNKKYINSIQNYIIITLVILLFNVIGLNTDIVIATIIIFLTIRIIIIFIELSKRIFIFSNTVIIGRNTASKIYDIFAKIQVGSYKYDYKPFQLHNFKQVNNNINSLSDLANSLIKDKDFEGMYNLLEINLLIIANYSNIKNKIPYNSLWFPDRSQPKYWFEGDATEILIAIETGTSLSSITIRDTYFLENRLFEINQKIIANLLKEKEFKKIYNYFASYNNCFKMFSKNGDLKYWTSKNEELIKYILSNINFDDKQLKDNKYIVGLIDIIGLYYIDVCNNFSDYLENSLKKLLSINWNKFDRKELLKCNNYIINNEVFSNFVQKLENERYVEKCIITKSYFCEEYIKVLIIRYLKDLIEYVSSSIEKLNTIAEKMIKLGLHKNAAIIYSRIIELNNKIDFRMKYYKKISDKLVEKEILNFKNENIEFVDINKKIKDDYVESVSKYCDVSGRLYFEKYDIDTFQIDFIGENYYHLTNLMLDLIIEDDYSNFEKLYKKFVLVCSIGDYLIGDIIPKDANPPYVISKYTMATINFMNISGLAIYYSRLKNDKRWEQLVIDNTNELVSKEEDKERFLNKCKTSAELFESNIFSHTLVDTNLKMKIERFIRSSGLLKFKCVGPFSQKAVDSKDEIISKFEFDDMMGFIYDFYEIYLVYCVNKHCEKDRKYKAKYNWSERMQ